MRIGARKAAPGWWRAQQRSHLRSQQRPAVRRGEAQVHIGRWHEARPVQAGAPVRQHLAHKDTTRNRRALYFQFWRPIPIVDSGNRPHFPQPLTWLPALSRQQGSLDLAQEALSALQLPVALLSSFAACHRTHAVQHEGAASQTHGVFGDATRLQRVSVHVTKLGEDIEPTGPRACLGGAVYRLQPRTSGARQRPTSSRSARSVSSAPKLACTELFLQQAADGQSSCIGASMDTPPGCTPHAAASHSLK